MTTSRLVIGLSTFFCDLAGGLRRTGLALCPVLALAPGCASLGGVGGLGGSRAPLSMAPAGSAQAMYEEAYEDLDDGLYQEALKGFAEVKNKHPYDPYAALAELRMGDANFERGKYSEAIDHYRTFSKYHPNHDEVAYAMFRIGESFYEQMPEPWWFLPPVAEKEQIHTQHAITAYQDVIARFGDGPQVTKARLRLRECRGRLADHELYVARFYFKRDRYNAAVSRLDGLLREYPKVDLVCDALLLKARSHRKLGQDEALLQTLKQLSERKPACPNASPAELARIRGSSGRTQ